MKKLTLGLCLAAVFSSTAMAQVCKPDSITPTHPEGQYLNNGNGTITDVVNGLMWSTCTIGQTAAGGTCTGNPVKYDSWQQALNAANENKSYAGYDDWRLPNIKELGDLVERSCVSPAINLTYFPSTPSAVYWSNTMDVHDVNPDIPIKGLLVDFTDGSEFLTDVNKHRLIRMVRPL
ncbi:DUF1566 domain-containing protein [Vibrio pomeroyi]|uniref:DUF1566 domain-containing protein n=1 Tax=Vibrio pomeroyi TaxID=198832 RepID=A0ABV4MQX4_9VIBR|nr:DUF1566 domain-containing protein [Vibrio atlanticus]MCZ4311026.1 DUF1566 domain-containing protein [Vibrio atlanticus]